MQLIYRHKDILKKPPIFRWFYLFCCLVLLFATSMPLATIKPTTKKIREIISVGVFGNEVGRILSDDAITNPKTIRDITA